MFSNMLLAAAFKEKWIWSINMFFANTWSVLLLVPIQFIVQIGRPDSFEVKDWCQSCRLKLWSLKTSSFCKLYNKNAKTKVCIFLRICVWKIHDLVRNEKILEALYSHKILLFLFHPASFQIRWLNFKILEQKKGWIERRKLKFEYAEPDYFTINQVIKCTIQDNLG